MQQTLVAINPVDDDSDSGGSSSGKTAGIAAGVVVGVLAIAGAIGIFFFLRRRKYNKISSEQSHNDEPDATEEVIRHGYDKGELGTGTENQRYEMPGSGPAPPDLADQVTSEWVDEKSHQPGNLMAEADGGGVSVPELTGSASQRAVAMRPLHEMYDPSAPATELPGDAPSPGELHGSNPTSPASSPGIFARRNLNRGSNAASPISQTSRRRSFRDRLSGRRASTIESLPSLDSPAHGAPSPPTRDDAAAAAAAAVGSGHSGEPFSPVSRADTFTPEPVSREGTVDGFPSPRSNNSNPLFSPVSPTGPSPEMNRGVFERLRLRQGR